MTRAEALAIVLELAAENFLNQDGETVDELEQRREALKIVQIMGEELEKATTWNSKT